MVENIINRCIKRLPIFQFINSFFKKLPINGVIIIEVIIFHIIFTIFYIFDFYTFEEILFFQYTHLDVWFLELISYPFRYERFTWARTSANSNNYWFFLFIQMKMLLTGQRCIFILWRKMERRALMKCIHYLLLIRVFSLFRFHILIFN